MGDIISKIQVGWLKWKNASGLLCDRKVPLKLKRKFYKMVVRPTMLYSVECWPLKEKYNTKLSVAEMRMFRWMSGFTLRDRIRNEHIREKVGVAPIEEKIRESRLNYQDIVCFGLRVSQFYPVGITFQEIIYSKISPRWACLTAEFLNGILIITSKGTSIFKSLASFT